MSKCILVPGDKQEWYLCFVEFGQTEIGRSEVFLRWCFTLKSQSKEASVFGGESDFFD